MIAASSASVNCWPRPAAVFDSTPPVAVILMMSAPDRTWVRTARMQSSAPEQMLSGRQQMHDVLAEAVDVAVTPVDRHRRPGGDHARTGHFPGRDPVAQGEDGVIVRAQVGHRGETGHQGASGEQRPAYGLVGAGLGHPLQPLVRVRFAGQVDMAVDQSGQHETVAQIHGPVAAFSARNEAVADFDDLVPSDHESFISQHNAGRRIGQQPPRLHEHGSPIRRSRRGFGGLPGVGGRDNKQNGRNGQH